MKCDVAVIGGGASGIAAAVAAAESGCHTLLFERYGFLGGLASSAMVGTICGLFYRGAGKPRYAVQGFAHQFSRQLALRSASHPAVFANDLHFLPYTISAFHPLGLSHLNAAGVQLNLHSVLYAVQTHAKLITELKLMCGDQHYSIKPGAVIDCTGQAIVSLKAGFACLQDQQYQCGAIVFQVTGLPQMEHRVLGLNLIRSIKRGIHQQFLEPACDRLSIVPGSYQHGLALLKLGLPEMFVSDRQSVTDYELLARKRSDAIIDYLYQYESLFKNLKIIAMPTQVGIRSGSRPQGLDTLQEQQVLNASKPDNGVAIGAWPIELWGTERKPIMKYFKQDDFYLIPADALVSCHVENLFFAGRGFSATELAMASARVIGTCLGTGYAAGKLAASWVQTGVWQNEIDRIRQVQVVTALEEVCLL